MGRVHFLETFDAPRSEMAGPSHSSDWRNGYAEGFIAGHAKSAEREALLSEEIIQSMADLAFTYAEARIQVLKSLEPLFRSILERLLPELVRHLLLPHILDELVTAANVDSASPMQLTVSPQDGPALSRFLSGAMPIPLQVSTAPHLGAGQVMLAHRGIETALDLDGLMKGIDAVLRALFDETAKRSRHG